MSNIPLSKELTWRGLIKDKSFPDLTWLDSPQTFYLGVDCGSADSLTIGNLAVFLLAKRLKFAGWNAVLLVGGATSLVGDPGGKEQERELPSRQTVQNNATKIAAQVKHLFEGSDFQLVDNYDWFKDVLYLEFLRDIGKHYSMTELLQRDYISERIGEHGSGISYAEFSYSLVQGYDYLNLYKNHHVVLQIGGSDQWGNMLSGVPLIRKKEGAEVHAMSMPLIVNQSTGKKFGKSEDGAVWLDASKTSVLDFYQFWINVDDAGLATYLKVYTFLSEEDINSLIEEHTKNPSARKAQKVLAHEVTKTVHGEHATNEVEQATAALVGGDTGNLAKDDLPTKQVSLPVNLVDLLVEVSLATSKTDARRLIESGGIYIDGQSINRDILEASDFKDNKLILRRGKAFKDSVLIELAS